MRSTRGDAPEPTAGGAIRSLAGEDGGEGGLRAYSAKHDAGFELHLGVEVAPLLPRQHRPPAHGDPRVHQAAGDVRVVVFHEQSLGFGKSTVREMFGFSIFTGYTEVGHDLSLSRPEVDGVRRRPKRFDAAFGVSVDVQRADGQGPEWGWESAAPPPPADDRLCFFDVAQAEQFRRDLQVVSRAFSDAPAAAGEEEEEEEEEGAGAPPVGSLLDFGDEAPPAAADTPPAGGGDTANLLGDLFSAPPEPAPAPAPAPAAAASFDPFGLGMAAEPAAPAPVAAGGDAFDPFGLSAAPSPPAPSSAGLADLFDAPGSSAPRAHSAPAGGGGDLLGDFFGGGGAHGAAPTTRASAPTAPRPTFMSGGSVEDRERAAIEREMQAQRRDMQENAAQAMAPAPAAAMVPTPAPDAFGGLFGAVAPAASAPIDAFAGIGGLPAAAPTPAAAAAAAPPPPQPGGVFNPAPAAVRGARPGPTARADPARGRRRAAAGCLTLSRR